MNIRTVSWIWVFTVSILCAGCQPSSQTDSMSLFYKANTVYKSGDYDAALKMYGQIIDSSFVSAAVYYNMGNCYIKKNELGSALVWYERALRLNPRDSDLLANWKYAKSMMKNPEVLEKRILKDRIFHLQFITDDEIVMILCSVLSGISILILLGLYLQWRFHKTMVLITMLSAVFIFHAFSFFAKLGTYDNQAIILSTAEVKYEPEEKATMHFTAYEGWRVRILKENSGWAKIERPDGLTGWLPRDLIERI